MPVAVVVAAGSFATVLAFDAADRTSSAYLEHLARADVGDVIVNTSLNTREIDDVIRTLPGVERVTTRVMLSVTTSGPEPRTRAQLASDIDEFPDDPALTFAQVWGSADGQFVDSDRPLVQEGHMAAGPNEIVMGQAMADGLGLNLGDTVELIFWESTFTDPAQLGLDAAAYFSEVVAPLGSERLTLVGIVMTADEVLPDELYPPARAIVSPDVAARYDCYADEPASGSTWAETVAALTPHDCAVNYRYHSVKVAGSCSACVLEALNIEMNERNAALAGISDLAEVNARRGELGPVAPPSYFLIPTETEREASRVAQAVRPTVTGLRLLGIAAAGMTVVLAGIAIVRAVRRDPDEQDQWWHLGVGRTAIAQVLGAPLIGAVTIGALAGVAAAWVAPRGAVGPVAVVSEPTRHVGATSWLVVAGTIVASGVVTGVAAAAGSARGPTAAAEIRTAMGARSTTSRSGHRRRHRRGHRVALEPRVDGRAGGTRRRAHRERGIRQRIVVTRGDAPFVRLAVRRQRAVRAGVRRPGRRFGGAGDRR